jgi:hypothetical protein
MKTRTTAGFLTAVRPGLGQVPLEARENGSPSRKDMTNVPEAVLGREGREREYG